MKIAILGAGGCFGLNLAKRLIKDGADVMGIGRSPLRPMCFTQELSIQSPSWLYRVYAIGRDNEFIMAALDEYKPDVIVNFAAQGEGAASFKPAYHWKYFFDTNATALVDLTARLHERPWFKRFIQIGTSELYGSVKRPSKETDAMVPSSPYAASKAAFDMHLMSVHKALGYPMDIIRPSNCYCPGQQLHRIIPRSILYAMTGQALTLDGGGTSKKSYLHADDLSDAIIKVMDNPPGEIYNVGPDETTSIREVVERCAKACGVEFDSFVTVGPERTGQDGCYWLDSSKIKSLGWRQSVSWEQGLEDMRRWVALYKRELLASQQYFRMRA